MDYNEGIREKIAFRLIKKYIAGSTTASLLNAVREINKKGMPATVTLLNDSVSDITKAKYNTNAYAQLIKQIARLHLNSNISFRPTQLGYNIDRTALMKNIEELVELARQNKTRLWIEDDGLSRGALIGLYERVKKIYPGVGLELMIEKDEIPPEARSFRRGDYIRIWYSSKFRGSKKSSKLHQEFLEKLSGSKAKVTVSSHDLKWIEKMLQNGLAKRNITFEIPLGYGNGKLAKLAKSKGALSVYVPYGKDWAQYIRNRISDGKMRGIAVKMLSDNEDDEKDAKRTAKK